MVKIGFIGCHKISWHCLKKICDLSLISNDTISIVFNYGSKNLKKYSAYSSFDTLQSEYNFPLHYVENVADDVNVKLLKKADLDILFIIGWHKIVPQNVLDSAKTKLGIHSSILPKDRGSSPINWQIVRGETKGGITLFHLTSKVDEGGIVDVNKYEITNSDDVSTVYDKAIFASLNALEKNWNDIHNLNPKSIPQDETKVTINDIRKPSDGLINWKQSAEECHNLIRAVTCPYPGAFTFWNKKKVFIWKSKISNSKETTPGEIIINQNKIMISTNKGCIEILSLQIENELICSPQVFLKSYNLHSGNIFENDK